MSINRNSKQYQAGLAILNQLHGGHAGEQLIQTQGAMSPHFMDICVDVFFGQLMTNTTLDLKTRELCILATIIPQNLLPQIKAHIEAAISAGATREEIEQLILQTAFYGGFASASNALIIAKEVFDAM